MGSDGGVSIYLFTLRGVVVEDEEEVGEFAGDIGVLELVTGGEEMGEQVAEEGVLGERLEGGEVFEVHPQSKAVVGTFQKFF